MSRWAHDPDAAADALIGRSLDAVDLSGRILLANPSGGLPATSNGPVTSGRTS